MVFSHRCFGLLNASFFFLTLIALQHHASSLSLHVLPSEVRTHSHTKETPSSVQGTLNPAQSSKLTGRNSPMHGLSSLVLSFALMISPFPTHAAGTDLFKADDVEGIAAITQSDLGQSVRRSIVGGAKLADKIDLKWERFSDSLRDEKKCDPVTNRRLFDNGFRRDGTRIGNPVLGALCDPEPLKPIDLSERGAANIVLGLAEETASAILNTDQEEAKQKVNDVRKLVGPAFSRASEGKKATLSEEDRLEESKRQNYNMDIYTRMRAYGEALSDNKSKYTVREGARKFDQLWGNKMMAALAPNADQKDFKSPFPAPDPSERLPYDEKALLDALGAVCVTLNKMQEGGLIGHWEISVPEDDYGNVVTIAVDDDISIGAQVLAREQNQPLGGSAVVALVRSAMNDRAKISYNLDTFFIDPSTTKQELYNPTQLLVSISDLGLA